MLVNLQTLCDHVEHLAELGEVLRSAARSDDQRGWIYCEIATESALIADIANMYVGEFGLAHVYFARRTADGDS